MARSQARCIFCEILSGGATAALVYEDDHAIAFLDTRPVFKGHCLLVPREHYAVLPELPQELVAPLFIAAQRLSAAVRTALEADGTFVAMNNGVSQSVPHLHIHVI